MFRIYSAILCSCSDFQHQNWWLASWLSSTNSNIWLHNNWFRSTLKWSEFALQYMLFWMMKKIHDDRYCQCTWSSPKCKRRGCTTDLYATHLVEYFDWCTNVQSFVSIFRKKLKSANFFAVLFKFNKFYVEFSECLCFRVSPPMITKSSEMLWICSFQWLNREKKTTRSAISVSFCEKVGRLAFGIIHVIYTIFMH